MKISTSILSISALLALAGTANAAPLYNWTSAYVGVAGSYNWSHSQASYDNSTYAGLFPIDPSNAAAAGIGLTAGASYQFTSGLVLGIEGGITYAHLSSTVPDLLGDAHHSVSGVYTVSSTTDWIGDLRGRLGFGVNNLLFFGTAGVSASHVTVDATDGPISDSATLTGFVFGGGVEKALTNKVSVKLEYLHTTLGNHTWFAGETYSSTSSGSGDSVRLGLNLHF